MPFIIIDQGASAIRHYQKPKSPTLAKISESIAIESVSNKGDQKKSSAYEQQHNTSHKVHTAQDIMTTPVHSLEKSKASIQAAWELLQKHKIKHLPIINNNKLVGLVSERDILKIYALKNSDKDNWYRTKVFAASQSMDIHQLSQVLFDEKIGSLPIINEDQELQGIITRSDILKLSSQYGPLEFWA